MSRGTRRILILNPAHGIVQSNTTPEEAVTHTLDFLPRAKLILTHPRLQDPRANVRTPQQGLRTYYNAPSQLKVRVTAGTTGFQSFLLSNFKYYLTLFSKFFSSFPHGTCSLSVSRQYLALDEIYHPLRAEIPINSTLRTCIVRGETLGHKTGFSPSMIPCSKRFIPRSHADNTSIDYNSETRLDHRFTI